MRNRDSIVFLTIFNDFYRVFFLEITSCILRSNIPSVMRYVTASKQRNRPPVIRYGCFPTERDSIGTDSEDVSTADMVDVKPGSKEGRVTGAAATDTLFENS